jgi:hypothetical protein
LKFESPILLVKPLSTKDSNSFHKTCSGIFGSENKHLDRARNILPKSGAAWMLRVFNNTNYTAKTLKEANDKGLILRINTGQEKSNNIE